MPLALQDLKILDLTHMAPGMFCTMILSDFGADVLRVERLSHDNPLDKVRPTRWGPERLDNVFYEAYNRNKRSIILNLKYEEARQIIYKLVQSTDIFVEGFRPGVVRRLGIDYQVLKEINPRLIYCSMSGYGQDGPYQQLAGHDLNYISMAGVQDMIGQRNGAPAIPMNIIADWAGATLHAVIGILIAVVAREKTGRGQYIDISYMDSVLSFVTSYAYDYLANGIDYRRGETLFNGCLPCWNIYETKDGKYFTVACPEPWFWENLCRALGREDFIPFQFDEGEKRDEIFTEFQRIFLTKSRDEWFDFLKNKDVSIGKVNSLGEAMSDPQVLHRRMVVGVEDNIKGKTKHVGIAIKLSETQGRIKSGAPLRGQHTISVLTELGYTRKTIDELVRIGVTSLS